MPLITSVEAKVAELRANGDLDRAADALLRGYGPEVQGFLLAIVGDEARADEAFALFAEDIWRGLRAFRAESAFRTWSYAVARRAALRVLRGERIKRDRFAEPSALDAAIAHVKTTTAAFKRTDVKDRLRELRRQLSPDEQTLLILRVDRALEWRDIAQVMAGADEALDAHAAALRKRFERLKEKLRVLAERDGLLPPR